MLVADGNEPVAALLVGGQEKLGQAGQELADLVDLGIPLELPSGGEDREAALARILRQSGVQRVVDLSDEPVLGYTARTRMASVALWCGATYEGADFCFTPPARPARPAVASVAVFGTGKRTGKTAIAGFAARLYREAGMNPLVLAMGRGGPAEPEVLPAGTRVDRDHLLRLVAEGRHASSDYVEDAMTSGVATVGAWRAGGGLAGGMAYSNFPAALAAAEALSPGLLVLEGSGAAIPPARAGAGVLVANAAAGPEALCSYFGLYRLLLADVLVLTMCEESLGQEYVAAAERCARSSSLNQPRVVCTVFRPYPLADISGRKIWFGTTANERAGPVLKQHLERTYGCEVVAMSHALARRGELRRDLEALGGRPGAHPVDALAVELKAAAVDVVTRWGVEHGLDVVYVDNRPLVVGGDGGLEPLLLEVAGLARARWVP